MTGFPLEVDKMRDKLIKRLVWIAENCEPDDPEDREYWKEYHQITEQLGIRISNKSRMEEK